MLAPYTQHVVTTSTEFRGFLDWLERQPWVAVDTETTGDSLYQSEFRVRLIQLGNATEAWVLPWDGWGRAAAVALLESDCKVLMHNCAYDMAVLDRQGIRLDWARVTDTMLAMRIAEPVERAGLKESANRHLDEHADLSQKDLHDAMKRNGWTWATVPIDLPIFLHYAGLDVVLTSRLFLLPVVQNALRSPVWQLEMDTAALCARMAHRGMRVDVEGCVDRRDMLMNLATTERSRLETVHGVNLGSPLQCGRWLFADPDANSLMTKVTDKGGISTDKDVLGKIVGTIPGTAAADVAAGILKVRGWEKMAKSYFQSFLDNVDSDGLMHPQILTSEARSSRMSLRNPALQTLPKDESAGVRSVVLPRQPSEVLISSDWDQIEMRLAAVFSRDEGMRQAFRDADANGGDFFTMMGASIYKDPMFQKTDPRRRIVKNANYALLYGAGANKIAATAQIHPNDARVLLDNIFRTYPGLRTLMDGAEAKAKAEGKIATLGGRILTVPPAESYKALNYVIQGCLPADSPVLTRTDGHMPIGEFIDGSEVWTGERWAPAVRISRGEDERVRVHLSDGRAIDCDTRHQFLALTDGSAFPEWVSVLKAEGATLIRDAAPVEWGRRSAEYSYSELFWLGYMLGNGTMRSNNSLWSIVFPSVIHGELANELFSWGLSRPDIFRGATNSKTGIGQDIRTKHSNSITVYGGTRAGHAYWTRLTGGGGAYTKRIPAWVYRLDRRGRQAVFNGIYAADGTDKDSTMKKHGVTVGVRPRSVTWEPIRPVGYTSANRSLAEDVLTLASTLGYTGRITTYTHVRNGKDVTHHTVLFHKNVQPLTVTSVERLGLWQEMYTLSVDDERHAFATSGVISKNSAAFLLKRTLVTLALAGLEDQLMLPVHDEVVCSVDAGQASDVQRILRDVMPIRDLPLEIGAEPSAPMSRWGVPISA